MTADPERLPSHRNDHAARRMLGTTVAITLVVVICVLAWTFLRDHPEPSSSAAAPWQRIALIDRSTGSVISYDTAGVPIDQSAGAGPVIDVISHRAGLALIGPTTAVLTGPTPISIDLPADRVVQTLETSTTTHLLIGQAGGGTLLIVDLANGSVIDVSAAASPTVPRMFVDSVRVNTDASRFAVADAANFQTIVVGPGIDGAAFLADRPIAVGDELIATSQTIDQDADVALVRLDRRNEALVPTEIPVGGTMIGDELVMVSTTGGVHRIAAGDQEAVRIATVPVPDGDTVTSVSTTQLGERFVVAGSTFLAVLTLDGEVLFSTTSAGPLDVQTPRPAWRCLPVGGGGVWQTIVDLGTGRRLADLTGGVVTDVSADGCAVIMERDGIFELVTARGRVRLGQLADVALAPNASAVVWTTTTGRVELVRIGADLGLGDPIELPGSPSTPIVAFL